MHKSKFVIQGDSDKPHKTDIQTQQNISTSEKKSQSAGDISPN